MQSFSLFDGVPLICDVFLKNKDMVVVEYKPNVEVELKDMLAIHEAERKLTNEKKHVALLDARGFVYVSDQAKKFGASNIPMRYRIAAALLVDSLAVRMLGNFYLNFNKPKVPTKMFSNEKKAIDWLKKAMLTVYVAWAYLLKPYFTGNPLL